MMDAAQWIAEHAEEFIRANDEIWACPEIAYQERHSAEVLIAACERAGLRVERGVAGIPTAFVAEYGAAEGGTPAKPVIAILGEYDALPGLSQDRVPYRKPVREGAPGHGCGHNMLGAAALAASVAVAEAIKAGEVQGTVRFYGCPAEEGGAGKVFMVRAGCFDDVDLTLTWHPSCANSVLATNLLAMIKVYFRFRGRTAHAAADPFNGRSALDGVELMNVGVNYLREHMPPDARVHYVITHGGRAPNVVPDFAESCYYVRSPKMGEVLELFERVKDIARGAALMTGTEVEIAVENGTSNLLLNDTINAALQAQMERTGAPHYSAEEVAYATAVAGTFPKGSVEELLKSVAPVLGPLKEQLKNKVLWDAVLPLVRLDKVEPGSTDVGDVSWVTPLGQINTVCGAFGTPGHSWQQVAQGGMSIGHKGMLYAGQVLAATALDFMRDPELLGRAQAEFGASVAETPYVCPIPAGVMPPVETV